MTPNIHCRVHYLILSLIYFNIILPSGPGLPYGLFPSGFPNKFKYAFLICPNALHTQLISSTFISSPLGLSDSQQGPFDPPFPSSLLRQNILLSAFTLRPSPFAYKVTNKTVIFVFTIFELLDRSRKSK